MAILINPFPVSAYHGPELFCDRVREINHLTSNVENGINTTILALRRMGKTGLLFHLFEKLQRRRNTYCLYVDIYATQNQGDFLNELASSILRAFPPKKSVAKIALDFLTSLRPTISYDNLTGQPEISFSYTQSKQREQTLSSILNFLDKLDVNVIIAIDEFQQIAEYAEKNTEALLRTLIQPLKNIHFIFSGSSKHVLSQIFTHNKRPFFGSTQMLELKSIDPPVYKLFIQERFTKNKRKISGDALEFICEWTRLHTYYTQVVCNRLFAEGQNSINKKMVQETCSLILKEQEITFFQYRNLLTGLQWQMLSAIAREEKLYKPTAGKFIAEYRLDTPSTVQRSLEALLSKEMIYKEQDTSGTYYSVYDCFLARWLQGGAK